jgi:hypothetical protein
MTLSIIALTMITFSTMPLNITHKHDTHYKYTKHNDNPQNYTEQNDIQHNYILGITTLNDTSFNITTISITILSIIALSTTMLRLMTTLIMAANKAYNINVFYQLCHYAECHFGDCCGTFLFSKLFHGKQWPPIYVHQSCFCIGTSVACTINVLQP